MTDGIAQLADTSDKTLRQTESMNKALHARLLALKADADEVHEDLHAKLTVLKLQ